MEDELKSKKWQKEDMAAQIVCQCKVNPRLAMRTVWLKQRYKPRSRLAQNLLDKFSLKDQAASN
jgi:hypothetical protein